jgi:GT2 family glycosyltransferase
VSGEDPAAIPGGSGVAAAAATVSVAIPTYNGRELLEGALPSLFRQTIAGRLHVIVVDDCSTDGTVEWLGEHWPDVEVVSHARNLGVTRSLRDCLAAATGEHVVLLNNDVELEPDCLERLVDELDREPRAATSCPKLLDFHRRERLDGAGDIYTWFGMPGRRGHGELDSGQYDLPEEVLGPCAAVAVYRRSAIADVGSFDEDFFSYYEDVDWSLRARLAGYTCRYVPGAVAYHMGGATMGKAYRDFTRYQLWRNGIWLIAKDLPGRSLLRHAPALIVGQLFHFTVAVRERRLGLWARAWRDALRGLPAMLAKRRVLQRGRRVSPAELERAILPVLRSRLRLWAKSAGRGRS